MSTRTEGSSQLPDLLAEHAELERKLADPAVHADQATARRVGRRYAELGPVVVAARELEQAREDLTAARESLRRVIKDRNRPQPPTQTSQPRNPRA